MLEHPQRVFLLALKPPLHTLPALNLPMRLHAHNLRLLGLFVRVLREREARARRSRIGVMSPVHARVFPGLAGRRHWQIFIRVRSYCGRAIVVVVVAHVVPVDLPERRPGRVAGAGSLRAVGRGADLPIRDQAAGRLDAGFLRRARARSGGFQFGAQLIFYIPFPELALVQMQPVLLRADDHAGSHEAHE